MQFIDLSAQQKRIKEKIDRNIQEVLSHGKYIMGPEIQQLESRLSEFVGVSNGIACASGTDALLMALMAYGVGPGDAIFTSPFTFIATAEVIQLLGATPVFVDVDPRTFNIDVQKLQAAVDALSSGNADAHPLPAASKLIPRGIIGVDIFGLPADYDAIAQIAEKQEMFVIEDGAQSFGAEYKGRKACSLGDIAATSFFPAKPLGCYGDGGMCFTNDAELAEKMKSIRVHGKGGHKYDNARIGINGRLDTIQAAILHAKFDIFPEEIEIRQEVAEKYKSCIKSVQTPYIPEDCKSVFAQYSVLAKDGEERSGFQAKLKEKGIPTAIYYPKPLHLQTAFAHLKYSQGDFPVSEDLSGRIFSLPMHPYLEAQDQETIAEILSNYQNK